MKERKGERAAWTEFVEGKEESKPNKYGAKRTNGYASIHESEVAASLQMLASRGLITEYKEQERIVLVPGNGKLRPVVYVADFTFIENGRRRVLDAKGYKTAIYRLKKRMAALLLGIEIEEV